MVRIFPDPFRTSRNFPDLSGKFRTKHSDDNGHWRHAANATCSLAHAARRRGPLEVKDHTEDARLPALLSPLVPSLNRDRFPFPPSSPLPPATATASPTLRAAPARTDAATSSAVPCCSSTPKESARVAGNRRHRPRLPPFRPSSAG